MPGGDRTGPWGLGPMTGRGAGYCAGYSVPGYMNPIPGRGFWGRGRGWFGRGGGRGFRHWYWATGLPGWMRAGYGFPGFGWGGYPYAPEPTAQEERKLLQEEAEFLKKQLEEVQRRLTVLEKAQAEEKK